MEPVARNRAPRLCPPGSHPSRLESPTGTVRVWLGVSFSPVTPHISAHNVPCSQEQAVKGGKQPLHHQQCQRASPPQSQSPIGITSQCLFTGFSASGCKVLTQGLRTLKMSLLPTMNPLLRPHYSSFLYPSFLNPSFLPHRIRPSGPTVSVFCHSAPLFRPTESLLSSSPSCFSPDVVYVTGIHKHPFFSGS